MAGGSSLYGIRNVPQNFNPRRDGPALLFFVLEGCPWCVRLKPVMNRVAATLGTVIPTYKVDSSSKLASAFKVSGYPTIIYIDNMGSGSVYKGERTVDAITGFVCTRTANRLSVCRR